MSLNLNKFYTKCTLGTIKEVINSLTKEHKLYEGLPYACSGDNMPIIKYILRKSKDIPNNILNRSLRPATNINNYKLVKMLIKLGANNFDDGLDSACARLHYKIIALLLHINHCKFSKYIYTDLNNQKVILQLLELGVPRNKLNLLSNSKDLYLKLDNQINIIRKKLDKYLIPDLANIILFYEI